MRHAYQCLFVDSVTIKTLQRAEGFTAGYMDDVGHIEVWVSRNKATFGTRAAKVETTSYTGTSIPLRLTEEWLAIRRRAGMSTYARLKPLASYASMALTFCFACGASPREQHNRTSAGQARTAPRSTAVHGRGEAQGAAHYHGFRPRHYA